MDDIESAFSPEIPVWLRERWLEPTIVISHWLLEETISQQGTSFRSSGLSEC